MTTNRETLTLSLADLDRLLPSEYLVLSPFDTGNDPLQSLRTVRNEESGQIYSFSSAQEYLQFVVSVAPRSVLAEERDTRYLLLSARYDADPWFHASVTHTVAALTRSSVILHRMKSDEISVRFALSQEEMTALIEGYRAYVADGVQEEAASDGDVDPFLADITYEHERGGYL